MFVIDANILITPNRLYYPPESVPGFWNWMSRKFASGDFVLLDRVANEIVDGTDMLSQWTKEIKITRVDSRTLDSLKTVNTHVMNMGCSPAAANEFFRNRVADQFVVAYAHAHNLTVITNERYQPTSKKVSIPNVCHGVGVEFREIFPWLHEQGLYLVEGDRPNY